MRVHERQFVTSIRLTNSTLSRTFNFFPATSGEYADGSIAVMRPETFSAAIMGNATPAKEDDWGAAAGSRATAAGECVSVLPFIGFARCRCDCAANGFGQMHTITCRRNFDFAGEQHSWDGRRFVNEHVGRGDFQRALRPCSHAVYAIHERIKVQEHMSNELIADEPARVAKQWRSPLLGAIMMLSIIACLHGPAWLAHIRNSMNPLCFNDDAMSQVPNFMRYYQKGLLADDYGLTHFLATLPVGVRAIYMSLAPFFDPRWVSKVIPYILMVVTLGAMYSAAKPIGGRAAGWAAVVLALAGDTIMARMAGGLPRSFAYPMLALAMAFLANGRMLALATVTALSAAFYPAVSVAAGIVLAAAMFVLPDKDRGSVAHWTFFRRCVLLGSAGLLTILLGLPMMIASKQYGEEVGPKDFEAYPEAGPGGRLGSEDRCDFSKPTFGVVWNYANAAICPTVYSDQEWMPGLCDRIIGRKKIESSGKLHSFIAAPARHRLVITFVWLFLAVAVFVQCMRESAARRLWLMLPAACIAYMLSRWFTPHLFWPQRHLVYAIPLLSLLALATAPAVVSQLFVWGRRNLSIRTSTIIASTAVLLACAANQAVFGRPISPRAGLTSLIPDDDRLLKFLSKTTEGSLVAGWPNLMSAVPYVALRPTFVNYETHFAFHKKYADEMRVRMNALIEGYFARSLPPLVRLRDEFHVRYLVIDRNHFAGRLPTYFQPFNKTIKKCRLDANESYEVLKHIPELSVFDDGRFVVLDLNLLIAGSAR